MKILVYGINYFPELTGIGKYTGEMCEWLAAQGHEVEVITAMPYYPKWQIDENYRGKWWHTEKRNGVTIRRCPLYVTQHVTAKTRIIHEISFLLSSVVYWLRSLFTRQDLIITIYPPLIIGIFPLLFNLIKGTPYVFHVQDLQVDAAKELGMIRNSSLLNLLFKGEKLFLRKARKVSSISIGMKKNLIGKGIDEKKFINLPNWVDLDFVKPLSRQQSLKKELRFSDQDKIVLYSGNLGEKQGLEIIVGVAERLKDRKDINFLLAGEGAAKRKLMEMVDQRKLDNVKFLPLRPYEELNRFLNMADLHLVLQKKGASDLVLPSKLNTILAAGGVPVITAASNTTLFDLAVNRQLGILIEPESEDALYDAIIRNIDKDNSEISLNARQYACENLSISNILKPFETELSLIAGQN
jgi:colanic acid biosynthesis glycosyl transferase WcaI